MLADHQPRGCGAVPYHCSAGGPERNSPPMRLREFNDLIPRPRMIAQHEQPSSACASSTSGGIPLRDNGYGRTEPRTLSQPLSNGIIETCFKATASTQRSTSSPNIWTPNARQRRNNRAQLLPVRITYGSSRLLRPAAIPLAPESIPVGTAVGDVCTGLASAAVIGQVLHAKYSE